MKRRQGFAIWLTGLPSSGKSTLARMLHSALEEGGFPSEVLDGDEVRERLTKGLGFSKKDRDENIRRIAFVAKLLTRVGGVAITAAISPYRASRDLARAEIGNFVEVYVQCPLQVCMQRDVKGLYAKALSGEVRNFTGISDPYEPPLEAEVVVHTERESREESLRTIVEKLIAMNLVPYHLLDRLPSERPEMNAVDASGASPRSHWMI